MKVRVHDAVIDQGHGLHPVVALLVHRDIEAAATDRRAIHHELVPKPSKAEEDQRQPVEKGEAGQAVPAYKRDRASQECGEYILGDGLLVSEAVAQGCRRWKRPHWKIRA